METISNYTSPSTISTERRNVRAGDQLRYLSHKASKGDTDVKNRLLDSVGEGEGGMIRENNTETNTLPYAK